MVLKNQHTKVVDLILDVFVHVVSFNLVDEDNNSFVKWRIHWIMEGAPFMDTNLYSPEEWTISMAKEQLSNLQHLNWEAIPEWVRNINSLDWTTTYVDSLLNANW